MKLSYIILEVLQQYMDDMSVQHSPTGDSQNIAPKGHTGLSCALEELQLGMVYLI